MVVCMAVLAGRLEEHADLAGLGVFAVTFAAVWSTWTSFAVYADLADERTRIGVMMTAAVLVGVMAASLGDLDDRADAFALALITTRVLAARAALGTGRLLAAWPAVQLGGITVPWIASLWVPAPGRYWLWAAALALEMVMGAWHGADDAEAARALAERLTRRRHRRHGPPAPLVVVGARAEHLGERLGTFMIIVLGEAVAQLVAGASRAQWEGGLAVTSLAGFAIVAGLWWLTFRQRSERVRGARLPLRAVLPAHLVLTGSVVLFAAALGELLPHPHADADAFWRWTAAGGLAGWFLVVAALAAALGPASRWVSVRALGTAAAALAAAAAGAAVDTVWFMLMLVAAVALTALPLRVLARPRAPAPPDAPG